MPPWITRTSHARQVKIMILHDPQTRQEWLMHRNGGIGGSDAACVVGLNQYKSNVQLWEEKVGLSKAKDISNQAAVAFGIAAEPVIRDLFQVEHPEFEIEHHPFRMYAEENHKWLYATLDGELMRKRHPGNQNVHPTEQRTVGRMEQSASAELLCTSAAPAACYRMGFRVPVCISPVYLRRNAAKTNPGVYNHA